MEVLPKFLAPHEYEYDQRSGQLFEVGKLFPPTEELPRIAKYIRGRKLYEGKHWELFYRAQSLLENTPHNDRLKTLYMAVNLVDLVITKPADLMYGEPPAYESGKEPNSVVQKRLNEIVEENNLNLLGHEIVVGAGYRGDSFLKTYFGYRDDFSEWEQPPAWAKMEPVIVAQDPCSVFPELSRGSKKRFKAINIAYVEWVINLKGEEIPYLYVERHTPGYIQYRRFRLSQEGEYNNSYGVGITQYRIEEEVPTGREENVVATGVPRILISHVPYTTTDEDWQGRGTAEKIESLIAAINDRLVQIDYILFKHSDPVVYGPDLEGAQMMNWGGRYIPVRKDETTPAYMTWDGKLEGAFKELETLINLVFQIAETPAWLFGTSIGQAGGSGTSHTDSGTTKARFMPILSKVKRIRMHVDIAMRDALYNAMLLDNVGNDGIEGFTPYEPTYPKIIWQDGIPRDEKEMAEVMQIRTGGRQTIDVRTAIKRMDGLDDSQAQEILDRIAQDEEKDALATPSVFNQGSAVNLDQQQGDAVNNG